MRFEKKFEFFLCAVLLLFSYWLMYKSFGYDSRTHQFRIARHLIGDFGLHLGLIRSFSLGNNYPPQSPFFPGQVLSYHYGLDYIVGQFERMGVPIDIGLNGISALFFSILLLTVYQLSQILFGKNYLIGITAVLLSIFDSSVSFFDYIKNRSLSIQLFKEIWRIPDYIHKGPADGSLVSLFFTLNVYLNQRHLIVALALSFIVTLFFVRRICTGKNISHTLLIFLGFSYGFTTRLHSLVFLGTVIVIVSMMLLFRKTKWIVPFIIPLCIVASFHVREMVVQTSWQTDREFFAPGFLALQPLTLYNFMSFWFANLGLKFFIIPLAFLFADTRQKKIFTCFFILFLIANLLKLGFRVEHNQSLIQQFLLVANIYVAGILVRLWQRSHLGKTLSLLSLIALTASGVMNLLVVKNDFQYPVPDYQSSPFMNWIVTRTHPDAVFLSRQSIVDPVVIAGRKNYFGSTYYSEVMGYNYGPRRVLAKQFFESASVEDLVAARVEDINYLVIPNNEVSDFFYDIHRDFLASHLPVVYLDTDVSVYRL